MKQKHRPDDYDISEVHTSVPLPVLPKNEQKYSDVIEILDFYENVVENVCGGNNILIHIGGGSAYKREVLWCKETPCSIHHTKG